MSSIEGSDGGAIRCVTLCPFADENPYLSRLTAGAEQAGVVMSREFARNDFVSPLLSDPPDVVHIHWLHPYYLSRWFRNHEGINRWFSSTRLGTFTRLVGRFKRSGIAIVWTVHNLGDHESRHPELDDRANRSVAAVADALLVHGESARSMVVERFGLPDGDKIHVVPHGNYIDSYPNEISRSDARSKLGIADDRCVFAFVGLIRPYKGVEDLVHGFREMNDSGCELLIAGKPLDAAYDATIRNACKGATNIQYSPGYIADTDMQLYLNAADVVVFPYRRMLTSGAALLAMSFGRACIAPRMGCMVDVLDDDGAILYDTGDSGGLVNALRCAANEKSRLAEMGAYNLKAAEALSWESIGEQLRGVYESVSRSTATAMAT